MIPTITQEHWEQWIRYIAEDEQTGMGMDRLLRHLQDHIGKHIPDKDADRGRWNQWLAGSYNLLAILSAMVDANPTFEMGVSRMFRKWRLNPFDHTPPPPGRVKIYKQIAELGQKDY